MDNNFIIETKNLTKEYKRDEFKVTALHQANIQIKKGEFVALMGPSGSGKSTLLHLIAAIDRPSSGQVMVLGESLQELSDKQIAHWRNENVGFVFQTFNLIPVLTARENVELPLLLTNLSKKERIDHAETALKLVGLGDRLGHYPRQLSGGQEQRVAIARAIVTDPALILADEPTGDLDSQSANEVLTILSKLNKEQAKTIVMVTHDPHAAKFASKIRHLEKGELLPEGTLPQVRRKARPRAHDAFRQGRRNLISACCLFIPTPSPAQGEASRALRIRNPPSASTHEFLGSNHGNPR